jgi:hypothetical protein
MTVELTFDEVINLKFLLTRQLPLELMRVIGQNKNEIHASLSRDRNHRNRLAGSGTFELNNGDKFQVDFVSDLRQPSSHPQPLHVTGVRKL